MKESWKKIIEDYDNQGQPISTILSKVNEKREALAGHLDIYPPEEKIFNAFEYCDINEIKVVIIGQDPYHGPDQATGLCFAVEWCSAIPPSLRNIKNELYNDLDIVLSDMSLESWAKQGVLLLNASLTVIQGQAGSQMKLWSPFTDYIIAELEKRENLIFIAWGAFAFNKLNLIDTKKHHIIVSSHPSPLSCYKPFKNYAAFKGSKPFSKVNNILKQLGKSTIQW